MHTDDYLLAVEGLNKKREWEQQIARRIAEIIVSPWMKPGFNIRSYWPLAIDKHIADLQLDEAVRVLNYMKSNDGKFVYKKVNGVITEVRINQN